MAPVVRALKRFRKAQMGGPVQSPARCLAYAVLQQAVCDRDYEFIRGEDGRWWCELGDVDADLVYDTGVGIGTAYWRERGKE